MTTYYYPKANIAKEDCQMIYLFFENGDFLEIRGVEIVDYSIKTYDKLVRSHKGVNPVAASGYLKLNILNKHAFSSCEHFLYNEKEFRKNRKQYIENRCLNESKITEIWFFDENNWHTVLLCNTKVKMDAQFLLIEFLSSPQMGSFEDKNNYANLKNLIKEDVFSIELDFENCESFVVYNDEIKEVNLVFSEKLEWTDDLTRKIIGGFIKIKLDKTFGQRENHLFDNERNLKISDFEKRLCGKKGEEIHDICHLYVRQYHAGYGGIELTECMGIDDIKSDEEIEALEMEEEKTGMTNYYYEGGYCRKLKDGSIIIAFGKNAKNTIAKFL